jgi:hypothetical protein
VVRHQAISLDPEPEPIALISQQLQVRTAVVFHKENILPVVPPLRYVVRYPRNDNSCDSWHGSTLLVVL